MAAEQHPVAAAPLQAAVVTAVLKLKAQFGTQYQKLLGTGGRRCGWLSATSSSLGTAAVPGGRGAGAAGCQVRWPGCGQLMRTCLPATMRASCLQVTRWTRRCPP